MKNIFNPDTKSYKIIFGITCVVATVTAGFLISRAGSLNPTSAPGNTFVNLAQLYCKLNGANCDATYLTNANNYGIDSPANPAATMSTIDEIYAAAPDFKNSPGTAAATDVVSGKTFYKNSATLLTGTYLLGLLTWIPARTVAECTSAGGSVYDTGSTGTICRFTANACPSGWAQTADWQQYSLSSWGGGDCAGDHTSTGPATFSNVASYSYAIGPVLNTCGNASCNANCRAAGWCIYSYVASPCFSTLWNAYNVLETKNGSANRIAVGCI